MKKLLIAAAITSTSATAFADDTTDKVTKTFSQLDSNDDGVLMADEINETPLAEKMAALDENSDEAISASEFDAFITDNPDMFTNRVFDKMEADRKMDGLDDPMETTTYTEDLVDTRNIDATAVPPEKMVMEQPGAKPEVIASAEFELLDVNQDGMLTKAEAMQSETDLDFSDMDADEDEMITQQEYADYIEELSEE